MSISIFVILVSAAVPGMRDLIARGRIEEASGSLRSAIELARSEALARGGLVGVCRSVDANADAPACSAAATGYGAADWAAGWIVYAKAAANTLFVFEAGDTLVRRQPPLGESPTRARVMLWGPAGDPLYLFGWNGVRVVGPVGSFAIDEGPPTGSRPAVLASANARCLGVNVVGRLEPGRAAQGICP